MNMITFLLSLPASVLLVLFMLGSATIGIAVHLLFRRLTILQGLRSHLGVHNELVGHAFGAAGVIYAVVLAFVVVTGWAQSDHTAETSLQERSYLSDLFEVVDGYPPRLAEIVNKIKRQIRLYSYSMSGEWNEMRSQTKLAADSELNIGPDQNCENTSLTNSAAANLAARCLRYFVSGAVPENLKEQVVYGDSMRLLAGFNESRQHRRYRYSEHLNPVMWLSLALGGAIMVVFISMLATKDSAGELVITAAVCAMIGMMLALTMVFDHPFSEMADRERTEWGNLSWAFSKTCAHPNVSSDARLQLRGGELTDLCQ